MANHISFQTAEVKLVPQDVVKVAILSKDDDHDIYTWINVIPSDPLECLGILAKSHDEEVIGLLLELVEYQKGCYINESWYEWEQIKPTLITAKLTEEE